MVEKYLNDSAKIVVDPSLARKAVESGRAFSVGESVTFKTWRDRYKTQRGLNIQTPDDLVGIIELGIKSGTSQDKQYWENEKALFTAALNSEYQAWARSPERVYDEKSGRFYGAAEENLNHYINRALTSQTVSSTPLPYLTYGGKQTPLSQPIYENPFSTGEVRPGQKRYTTTELRTSSRGSGNGKDYLLGDEFAAYNGIDPFSYQGRQGLSWIRGSGSDLLTRGRRTSRGRGNGNGGEGLKEPEGTFDFENTPSRILARQDLEQWNREAQNAQSWVQEITVKATSDSIPSVSTVRTIVPPKGTQFISVRRDEQGDDIVLFSAQPDTNGEFVLGKSNSPAEASETNKPVRFKLKDVVDPKTGRLHIDGRNCTSKLVTLHYSPDVPTAHVEVNNFQQANLTGYGKGHRLTVDTSPGACNMMSQASFCRAGECISAMNDATKRFTQFTKRQMNVMTNQMNDMFKGTQISWQQKRAMIGQMQQQFMGQMMAGYNEITAQFGPMIEQAKATGMRFAMAAKGVQLTGGGDPTNNPGGAKPVSIPGLPPLPGGPEL